MNVAADVALSKAAFMDWLRFQERRHELKNGRIVMMAGVSRAHMRLCVTFLSAMRDRLDPGRYDVALADFAVEMAGDTIRYPDVLVEHGGGAPEGRTTTEPLILVEVLSPSSVKIDLREKVEEYLAFPSLLAYVVASQDEPVLWVWTREAEGFPSEPVEIAGADQTLTLPLLASSIPLSELYAKIRVAGFR